MFLLTSTRMFVHGHTYQGHPAACAGALEVQRIIREEGLVANVAKMGTLLSTLLRSSLGDHPNIGDIRGRGLFWGIEFVTEKETNTPFPSEAHVAMEISELGMAKEYSIAVYPGTGTAEDGIGGDHIIIAPPYNVNEAGIRVIVSIVGKLVNDYFSRISRGSS